MTKQELLEFLLSVGFKLVGSQALGLANKNSDVDLVTTDDFVYKKTLWLLKNSGKVKYVKDTKYEDEYSGSICIGKKKVGTYDVLRNPISSDETIFDLHLVEKILPKNKQLLLHYEKYIKKI